jgi:hypothetical protein
MLKELKQMDKDPILVGRYLVDPDLSKPKTIQKSKQMNSPKETFKNATAILSLVWSVGKVQDYVCR